MSSIMPGTSNGIKQSTSLKRDVMKSPTPNDVILFIALFHVDNVLRII